jgi:hypothetical protein
MAKVKIGDINETGMASDADAPRYKVVDGYMVLEGKSADIPLPKSKPKAQRKKTGGTIGSGFNRLY